MNVLYAKVEIRGVAGQRMDVKRAMFRHVFFVGMTTSLKSYSSLITSCAERCYLLQYLASIEIQALLTRTLEIRVGLRV